MSTPCCLTHAYDTSKLGPWRCLFDLQGQVQLLITTARIQLVLCGIVADSVLHSPFVAHRIENGRVSRHLGLLYLWGPSKCGPVSSLIENPAPRGVAFRQAPRVSHCSRRSDAAPAPSLTTPLSSSLIIPTQDTPRANETLNCDNLAPVLSLCSSFVFVALLPSLQIHMYSDRCVSLS